MPDEIDEVGRVGDFFFGDAMFKQWQAGLALDLLHPLPPPPPLPEPTFIYRFQGMDLVCPGWAKFVAQNATGIIKAYEFEPRKIPGDYAANGGKLKILAAPEKYDCILESTQDVF